MIYVSRRCLELCAGMQRSVYEAGDKLRKGRRAFTSFELYEASHAEGVPALKQISMAMLAGGFELNSHSAYSHSQFRCLRAFTRPRLCARCGFMRYCTRQCQQADWSRHRSECTAISWNRQSRRGDNAFVNFYGYLGECDYDLVAHLAGSLQQQR